ncbi:11909_t:CDS:2, partial [Ambispora leptoticha]
SHGHFLVNGKKVNIPSYKIEPGQVISLKKEKVKENKLIKNNLEQNIKIPSYLAFDKEKLTITYLRYPTAEELKEVIINQEIEQIQEILNKFKQPIPSNFKKLGDLKNMCSTQGLKRIRLEAKNIPYPVHISPTVLDKGLDHYFAYNVEDEEEIFLDIPLTINNLPSELTR